MPIVFYLGKNVNEYNNIHEEIIKQKIADGDIRCDNCTRVMRSHSKYQRHVKETGAKIEIIVVWCRKCHKWEALQPDFLLRNKHYSGNEIESVIIDSATESPESIDTAASLKTVIRWIKQIGERIKGAISKIKYIFLKKGKAVSELTIKNGSDYEELEYLLQEAPDNVEYSGNKIGLANIWLGTTFKYEYI